MSWVLVGEMKGRLEQFLDQHPWWVVIVWGGTATGKTSLSVALADSFDLGVVSADSRQIFRFMDIGTDKISSELREKIPHFQIDIVNPDQLYTAGQWKSDSELIIDGLLKRQKVPFVVGGTWLYLDTLYKNFLLADVASDEEFRKKLFEEEFVNPGILYQRLSLIDPQEAEKLHPHSIRYIIRALEIFEKTGKMKSFFVQRRKPRRPLLMVWLWRSKEDANVRIDRRVKEMLAGGLIEETQWLLDQWYDRGLQSMQGIGYKQCVAFLLDHGDRGRLEDEICQSTHYLAKKQRTWFRRYIADGEQGFEGVEYEVYDLGWLSVMYF